MGSGKGLGGATECLGMKHGHVAAFRKEEMEKNGEPDQGEGSSSSAGGYFHAIETDIFVLSWSVTHTEVARKTADYSACIILWRNANVKERVRPPERVQGANKT